MCVKLANNIMTIKNFKKFTLESPENIDFKKGDIVERLPRQGVIDRFNKVGTLYQLEEVKYDEYDGWTLTVLGGGVFTYSDRIKDVRKLYNEEIESRKDELDIYLKEIKANIQLNKDYLKNIMTSSNLNDILKKIIEDEDVFDFETYEFDIELKVKRK